MNLFCVVTVGSIYYFIVMALSFVFGAHPVDFVESEFARILTFAKLLELGPELVLLAQSFGVCIFWMY